MLHMILAMVHYPGAQKKAQAHLDEVLGGDRLPQLSDRDRLPYIDCLIKEVLRWGTPVALCMLVGGRRRFQLTCSVAPAHLLMQDDEYRGYTIPKGSYVSTLMTQQEPV